MYRELLLGCGHKKEKRIGVGSETLDWRNVTTLDINEDCKPDIVADFEKIHISIGALYCGTSLISEQNAFDEIHAYEFLEHLGMQGDYRSFFHHFSMLWYMLKPNGYLCATTPSRYSPWLWGDPGHRRVIIQESLTFLDQTNYVAQKGRTSLSDYRFCYTADFKVLHSTDDRTTHTFILQAVKPIHV